MEGSCLIQRDRFRPGPFRQLGPFHEDSRIAPVVCPTQDGISDWHVLILRMDVPAAECQEELPTYRSKQK